METEKLNCYSCGGSFAREELQFRPSGRGAYRKVAYYCPTCNEREKKKDQLKATQSLVRKTLPSRPASFQLRPAAWNK
ncbi:hypothetical protein ACLH17_18675 [Klebsiella pasteurii]|uniref:hypothetical protein n=1 Tax=Klebsiella TaxID=570 RepID=UPI000FFF4D29|nr:MULTISPECIES: hypothetical protein [Klebsiella]MDD9662504.1 hypothetical protein [Klebsiella pasteurii]MDD9667380.1 hypothetical protein [Klebsiella pasteurii]MDD9686642.1 hypothetical protein [Klebsiella pasteurii]MDL4446705.1 hypothetical protein [Klebsiella michiganensis]MDL4490499.1 hypothetical protein [Klebsiella michiganensis]